MLMIDELNNSLLWLLFGLLWLFKLSNIINRERSAMQLEMEAILRQEEEEIEKIND